MSILRGDLGNGEWFYREYTTGNRISCLIAIHSVMNKIVEDEIDSVSVSDTLSQASLSQLTDEGSPKSLNSTVIVRRSSLTGQIFYGSVWR